MDEKYKNYTKIKLTTMKYSINYRNVLAFDRFRCLEQLKKINIFLPCLTFICYHNFSLKSIFIKRIYKNARELPLLLYLYYFIYISMLLLLFYKGVGVL